MLPAMRRQRAGCIFNLSSVGGMLGFAGASVYCATKFALEGFSESLALEVADFGIRVTIVEPGFFRTDFLDGSSGRYGNRPVDDADYASRSAQWRDTYEVHNHRQAGDPAKLGLALVRLAGEANLPLRYAAGADALQSILDKLEQVRGEMEQWSELSRSTDGPFRSCRRRGSLLRRPGRIPWDEVIRPPVERALLANSPAELAPTRPGHCR
ncbi:SDR family NAD(P)-dependent oxidoreductase [Pseudomonas sp. PIC25]|uniref:SDR family NAD(P)-dependent oxidoreductase n=1 Tax=Pseudomonas sp. PIC25 TaxID=1958773 RepID=UPI002114F8A5|nr:SDR family NAD(P)-dependent oxidoreductase [Pseudomonas sp. PIC25]